MALTFFRPLGVVEMALHGVALTIVPALDRDTSLPSTDPVELQRAPDSGGSPGTWVTIVDRLDLPPRGLPFIDARASTSSVWWYRYRHVAAGGVSTSDWTPPIAATVHLITPEMQSLAQAGIPLDARVVNDTLQSSTVLALATARENELVLNGTFEAGFAYWDPDSSQASIETGADVYAGAKSLKVVGTTIGETTVKQHDVATDQTTISGNPPYRRVVPGMRLLLSAVGKTAASSNFEVNPNIGVRFHDATKKFISASSVSWTNTENSYVRKSTVVTVPANAYYATIWVSVGILLSGSGTFWCDNIQCVSIGIDEPVTGIRVAATDTVEVRTSGALRVTVKDTLVAIGTVGTLHENELFRVRTALNATSPLAFFENIGDNTRLWLRNESSDHASIAGQVSAAGPGATINDTPMLLVEGWGYTGSAWSRGSFMIFNTSEAWGASAKGSYIRFFTILNGTTTPVERFIIRHNGSLVCGVSALATTATVGFIYIPSCAGTPTGTPAAETGMIPLVYDSTNNILYAYSNGAWRAH